MNGAELTQYIGSTLRRLRRERNWTLEQLADATGVSKPMLGQIERGETNPTVVTLWKIATGLTVSFSTFLQDIEKPQVNVVRKSEQPVVVDEGGRYVVRGLLGLKVPHSLDVFEVDLDCGASHASEGHGPGVTEGVWVQEGHLSLMLGSETYVLGPSDSVYFQANLNHVYYNKHKEHCKFTVLLAYARVE